MLKCISLKIEESRAPTLGIMAKVALRGLKMFPRGKDFLKFGIERDVFLIQSLPVAVRPLDSIECFEAYMGEFQSIGQL